MKLDRLDTHDRLLEFRKQADSISQACITCINNVPDEITFPFYVFAHPRTLTMEEQVKLIESGQATITNVPTHKLVWGPRITKPKAQTNSYLFLAKKNSDAIQIIWKIPARELWEQYAPGQMTYDEDTWISIQNFQYAREKLEAPDENGPTTYHVEQFRRILGQAAHNKKKMLKQATSVASIIS